MEPSNYHMPLYLALTPNDIRLSYDEHLPLPAHDIVLRPLLYNSLYSYVYGLTKESELYKDNAGILNAEKGKFKINTDNECIRGHEYLWNAQRRKRGSIVIICKPETIDFGSVFKGCYRLGLMGTPNAGNTLSATKYCRQEMEQGNIAICFPANNGFDSMLIYVKEPLRSKLFFEAKRVIKEGLI